MRCECLVRRIYHTMLFLRIFMWTLQMPWHSWRIRRPLIESPENVGSEISFPSSSSRRSKCHQRIYIDHYVGKLWCVVNWPWSNFDRKSSKIWTNVLHFCLLLIGKNSSTSFFSFFRIHSLQMQIVHQEKPFQKFVA